MEESEFVDESAFFNQNEETQIIQPNIQEKNSKTDS